MRATANYFPICKPSQTRSRRIEPKAAHETAAERLNASHRFLAKKRTIGRDSPVYSSRVANIDRLSTTQTELLALPVMSEVRSLTMLVADTANDLHDQQKFALVTRKPVAYNLPSPSLIVRASRSPQRMADAAASLVRPSLLRLLRSGRAPKDS
jgi:hypothetical protein